MADFVFIHGTTQGPEGWNRLVAVLESRGHRCVAVDLSDGQEHSLAEYARAVRSQVPPEMVTPVVVAHSGTGPVLPGAALLLNARRQVWLAAIIPDGRSSLLAEIRSGPTEVFNPEWLGKDPTADPVLAAYFLFQDCDLETLEWALLLGFVRPSLTEPDRYLELLELHQDLSLGLDKLSQELHGRPMGKVVRSIGIPEIEVEAARFECSDRHGPGLFAFAPLGPPHLAADEFLEAHWLGL